MSPRAYPIDAAIARGLLFKSLNKKQRSLLAPLASVQRVPAGAVLYQAGTIPPALLSITSGSLERIRIGYEDEVVVSILGPGDAAGYVNLGDPAATSPFSLRAAETAELLSWNLAALAKKLSSDSGMRASLLASCIRLQQREQKDLAAAVLLGTRIPLIVEGTGTPLVKQHAMLELLNKTCGGEYALCARFDPSLSRIVVETSYNLPRFPSGTHISMKADTVLSLVYRQSAPLIITPKTYERKHDSASYGSPNMAILPLTAVPGATGALLVGHSSRRTVFSRATISRMRLAACGIYLLLGSAHQTNALKELEYLKRSYVGSFHDVR